MAGVHPKRGAGTRDHGPSNDTVRRHLTKEERAKLSMDAWEPSLLRRLLRAQNKLDRDDKD